MPSYARREEMPYLQATMQEILRISNICKLESNKHSYYDNMLSTLVVVFLYVHLGALPMIKPFSLL